MALQVSQSMAGLSVHRDGTRQVSRTLPEEQPVALVFNGTTAAVMMATPDHLKDFAIGFALTEGFIDHPNQVKSCDNITHAKGTELRVWLDADRAKALHLRRRNMLGPVGCGLCGIDSLEQAIRPLPVLLKGGVELSRAEVAAATDRLRDHQPLHDQTHAVHAAGFLVPHTGIVLSREDVGRHNALDKLIGAIVLTSRVSVDMVQKTVIAGCPVLIAVSAPTALALRLARDANLTLAAFARGGGFDVYSHPERILCGASDAA